MKTTTINRLAAIAVTCCTIGGALEGRAEFKPRVAEGTEVFLACKSTGKGAAVQAVDWFLGQTWLPDYKSRRFKDARKDMLKLGLDKFVIDWAVVSLDGILETKMFSRGEPDFSVAIGGRNDAEEYVERLERLTKEEEAEYEGPVFETFQLSGEKAWRVASSRRDEEDPDICMTSLDGELILVASSQKRLEAQINLYRKGTGAFAEEPLGDGDALMIVWTNAGPLFKGKSMTDPDNLPPEERQSGISEALGSSGRLSAFANASRLGFSLNCASADDAAKLARALNRLVAKYLRPQLTDAEIDKMARNERVAMPVAEQLKVLRDAEFKAEGTLVSIEAPNKIGDPSNVLAHLIFMIVF